MDEGRTTKHTRAEERPGSAKHTHRSIARVHHFPPPASTVRTCERHGIATSIRQPSAQGPTPHKPAKSTEKKHEGKAMLTIHKLTTLEVYGGRRPLPCQAVLSQQPRSETETKGLSINYPGSKYTNEQQVSLPLCHTTIHFCPMKHLQHIEPNRTAPVHAQHTEPNRTEPDRTEPTKPNGNESIHAHQHRRR